MDKIKLKDGNIIEIEESRNGGSFRKRFADPQDYLTTLAMLNQDNLSAYQVQNSAGLDITFNVSDVDMLAKAVKDMQAGQQALQEGQDTQDGAIFNLGETVAILAEGSVQ